MAEGATLKLASPSAKSDRGAFAHRGEAQQISDGRLSHEDRIALLKEAVPALHGLGKDGCVEAVCDAIDRLDWSPLHLAPRDGTSVIVLFGGEGDWPPYFAFARWIVPEAGELLNYRKRQLLNRFGGWWGSGRGKPHRSAALAWVTGPSLPSHLLPDVPDTATGCADDQGLYAQDLAA